MSLHGNVAFVTGGGTGIGLVVGSNSSKLTYDCAEGEITEKLTIDKLGNFDLKGVHISGMPGPVYIDRPPNRQPVRYTGRITGNTMTLKVVLTDSETTLGNFELDRQKTGRLRRCL